MKPRFRDSSSHSVQYSVCSCTAESGVLHIYKIYIILLYGILYTLPDFFNSICDNPPPLTKQLPLTHGPKLASFLGLVKPKRAKMCFQQDWALRGCLRRGSPTSRRRAAVAASPEQYIVRTQYTGGGSGQCIHNCAKATNT